MCANTFSCIGYEHLVKLECLFHVRIYVYTLQPDGMTNMVWLSQQKDGKDLHVIDNERHFRYIKKADTFAKAFHCEECGCAFGRPPGAGHTNVRLAKNAHRDFWKEHLEHLGQF